MPPTRLHINLSEGIIEAEGEVAFVQQVYDDFKDRITQALDAAAMDEMEDEDETPHKKHHRED